MSDFSWGMLLNPMAIPIVAIIGGLTYAAIHSIAEAVASVYRRRADADLKMELSARGMSADEIVRVVESGRNRKSQTKRSAAGPAHAG